METIRSNGSDLGRLYLPQYIGARESWEVVYFLTSVCDGTCAHCWSSFTFLGKEMPLSWHREFWRRVSPKAVKEIRLTGGEPFLCNTLSRVISEIRNNLGEDIPIKILTSGRQFVALTPGEEGIRRTVQNLHEKGVVWSNVEIHMSAEEYHAGSLFRLLHDIRDIPDSEKEIRRMDESGLPFLREQAKNFLAACERIRERDNKEFNGGKIKVHVDKDRLDFHRVHLFDWMTDEQWQNNVISSEGLVKSGKARQNIENAKEVTPNNMLSLFLLPGAEFRNIPRTGVAQAYYCQERQGVIYLDAARKEGVGASFVGWWNIINRTFCGGSTYDALCLIGY